MSLLEDVLDAHGGLARWEATESLSLRLSSGGLALASKGQPHTLGDVTATVSTTGQSVGLDGAGWRRRFDDHIPPAQGVTWTLDAVAAFAAAALWTYASIPFVLNQLDVQEDRNRLIVRFPPHLRTHSPRQVLHIDRDGLIRRHDYTALDFGRWAAARQTVSGYRDFDGFRIATRRRVHPRAWPHRPQLVWIDVHDASAVPRTDAAERARG